MTPLNSNDISLLQMKYQNDQTVLDLIEYIIELETQYLYGDDYEDE